MSKYAADNTLCFCNCIKDQGDYFFGTKEFRQYLKEGLIRVVSE